MGTFNNYNLLSKIFRQLVEERQHFHNQFNTLKIILDYYDFSREAKILDAASGTGDVVIKLSEDGYKNLYAIDGSPFMLSQWPNTICNIKKRENIWENIHNVFDDWGCFNFVYFLGNSLPHLSADKLPYLFNAVYEGLNDGGVFVFDIRSWTHINNGALTQLGREHGVMRLLGNYDIEGNTYWLFEEVKYFENQQNVTYTLMPKSKDQKLISETVAYSMFDWKYAKELLIQKGFQESSIKIMEIPKWPYLVVSAKKL